MKWILALLLMLASTTPAEVQDEMPDEAAVREFVNGFFARFVELRDARQTSEEKSTRSLASHAVAHFTEVSEADRRRGRIPPVDLVSALFMHGPKTWRIERLKVAGDVARVDVHFTSVMDDHSDQIPLSFRLIRAGGSWKFLRFEDLRPPAQEAPAMEKIKSVNPDTDLVKTLRAYMDFVVQTYEPAHASKALGQTIEISKALEPMWVDTRDARRAAAQLHTSFMQLQPLDWKLIDTVVDGDQAYCTVELIVGNKQLVANAFMLKFWGGERECPVFSWK